MGAYKYIAETLQKQYKERNPEYRAKIIAWRAGPAMVRVEAPANIARARILGYKAKQGYIVVRTRVDKGRRTRRRSNGGRKHKNYYMFVQPQMSHQAIAEQRVNRVYRNMEVLNSYWVGEDGNYKFFEVILADPTKPSVNVSSAVRQGKSFRGLTSAGNSRTPSKKKTPNKKLRRKDAQMTPYHYEPYVKKEQVAQVPKHKDLKQPVKKAASEHKAEHKAAEHKAHEAKPEHKPHEAKHETHHKKE
ncbi:MAG TPA: hypothetical protein VLD37_03180 [Candidatus Bilamarchaeum sp.]|nr:hypothetical protein [Candidatus Bilamarchaeum sp.]